MTDESEEKRPRLQLSSKLNPTEPEKPTEPSATEETAAAAPPAPKLQVSKPAISSEQPRKAPSLKQAAPSPGSQAPPPPPPIEQASPPPLRKATPTLLSQKDSLAEDSSAPVVEKNLDHLESKTDRNQDTFSGIIIIVILLLILGAAGFGIWWVLKDPAAETNTAITATETETPAAAAVAQPSNPIQRAKETIAKVPVTTVPEINTAPVAPPKTQTPASIPAPQPAAPSEASVLQQAVTQFLADAHIGGVRTGNSPRVTIGGETYNAGDIIDETLNLSFIGIQDGRLLFKDRNGVHYLKSF
ncbi:MAG: hypothetical protein ACSHX4_14560 [Opitutaceae bacterium]